MAEKSAPDGEPITIKKYANRRLYNTASSSYVTLDHLCQMVKEGQDFVVYDAKSGADITRSVLTQIIVEEEAKGQNLLPVRFLRQLIGFYGDNLQSLVPGYLEASMESFSRNQEQMRAHINETFGESFPLPRFEEMGRQNLAFFQRAMDMFNPLAGAQGEAPGPSDRAAGEGKKGEDEIDELRNKLEAMERQLDALAKKQD
jgi:polyhydroxyalkanoate synthesis repressor PhaR